ncbi:MAG: OmpA family protein [Myxococcaceae bacterium]
MNRRVLLAIAAAGSLLALTGCPPAYPKCSNDESCKDHNEVCVEGQCQECAKNENCKEGFVCEANKCVPKPECTTADDCGSGKKCKTGKCVAQDFCQSDSDCGTGKCNKNKCIAKNACTTNDDCGSGEECKGGTCQQKTEAAAPECKWDPIRFGFNDYQLDADGQNRLSSLADCIKKSGKKVTLEGHADERGTEEYNLQLSNKRAASVKKYLTDLGVKGGSLDTVGYGENRPANNGHDEAAWAENRRVEFKR